MKSLYKIKSQVPLWKDLTSNIVIGDLNENDIVFLLPSDVDRHMKIFSKVLTTKLGIGYVWTFMICDIDS